MSAMSLSSSASEGSLDVNAAETRTSSFNLSKSQFDIPITSPKSIVGTFTLPENQPLNLPHPPSFQFENMTRETGNSGPSQIPKSISTIRVLDQVQPSTPISSLSPFQRIKIEEDKKRAYGHPVVMPTPYARYGPVFDVIALYQNAIKRQSLVAYNIMEAMLRYKYDITKNQTAMFWTWFHTFEDATLSLLATEEQIVYPFLTLYAVQIPANINIENRKQAKDVIATELGHINDSIANIKLMPAGESVSKISKIVAPFLSSILSYFERQRLSLPHAIVNANIPVEDETKLRVQFMKSLKSHENAPILIAFVSHWLSDRQLKVWKSKYLASIRGFTYDRWLRKFKSNHLSIPQRLDRRLAALDPLTPKSNSHTSLTSYFVNKKRDPHKTM